MVATADEIMKPEPPQTESVITAARSPRRGFPILRRISKQSASRDVEAPDGPAEMPVAEIDGQRRQEEADRANRVYALSMDTDGPRFDEPVTVRFDAEIADDIAANLKTAKALMLTVGESGGCRSAAGSRFPV
jgi:hypothetical protein